MLLYAINLASHILRLGIRIIVWVFGKGTQRLFCFISKLTRRNNRFGWDFTRIVCIVLFGTYLYYAVGYYIFKVFGWRSFVEVKLRLYKSKVMLFIQKIISIWYMCGFNVHVYSIKSIELILLIHKLIYQILIRTIHNSLSPTYFSLTCKIKINRFLIKFISI